MTDLRPARPDDLPALAVLYPAAFPNEDLMPLVRQLHDHDDTFSLVREGADGLVGHIAFSRCSVGDALVFLLAPLAVAPAAQRQGIGSALIDAGLERCREAGAASVCVLGDPAYYGRFGFLQEDQIAPPFPIPRDWRPAWQSVHFGTVPAPSGTIAVPGPWKTPALWLP